MACEVFSPGIWWIGLRVNLSGSWIQFGDGFVWFEAAKGLESPSEVVGCDEVRQVRFELFVGVIEEAFDGGFLDGAVHAFDLSVGPGMVGLGQTVADAMTKTGAIEGVSTPSCRKPSTILRQIGELDSVVGEHSVDAIGNCPNECFEEGCGRLHIGLFKEFDHSELRGPVDGHEEVEFAFGRSHFRQIDMEEADRIAVELLPPGLVAFHLGRPADAMAFQPTVMRRSGQARDRGLQGVEAVVQRQERVLAKRDDDGLLLHRQNRRPRHGWPSPAIRGRVAPPPLSDSLLVDAMPPRQRPQTLLTMLYRSTDRLCRCGAPVQYLSHSASFHSLEKYAPPNAGTKHLIQKNIFSGPSASPLDNTV